MSSHLNNFITKAFIKKCIRRVRKRPDPACKRICPKTFKQEKKLR